MLSEGRPARSRVVSSCTGHASRETTPPIKGANAIASRARERLRKHYRPHKVRILFVGESPPASGRFFYQADSGLYRAVRDTFATAFPSLPKSEFLKSFRSLGCYLVDLCGQPVDHMSRDARECAVARGKVVSRGRFGGLIRKSWSPSIGPFA
jgi:hypothetical protein